MHPFPQNASPMFELAHGELYGEWECGLLEGPTGLRGEGVGVVDHHLRVSITDLSLGEGRHGRGQLPQQRPTLFNESLSAALRQPQGSGKFAHQRTPGNTGATPAANLGGIDRHKRGGGFTPTARLVDERGPLGCGPRDHPIGLDHIVDQLAHGVEKAAR